ncbi:hypothetical protein ACFSSC_05655 [Corynebacterium mendelii]|uniref:Uncharacterized protein n=1 Tax=Corynebacterium mendelii TaxID=2765362 RepID=A0A939DZJ9_9CORY|nr:hypothetical protein [Corynebacterium mendelii]MBN9643113.1 hypothetical protein [Corynebacterium mendelii]
MSSTPSGDGGFIPSQTTDADIPALFSAVLTGADSGRVDPAFFALVDMLVGRVGIGEQPTAAALVAEARAADHPRALDCAGAMIEAMGFFTAPTMADTVPDIFADWPDLSPAAPGHDWLKVWRFHAAENNADTSHDDSLIELCAAEDEVIDLVRHRTGDGDGIVPVLAWIVLRADRDEHLCAGVLAELLEHEDTFIGRYLATVCDLLVLAGPDPTAQPYLGDDYCSRASTTVGARYLDMAAECKQVGRLSAAETRLHVQATTHLEHTDSLAASGAWMHLSQWARATGNDLVELKTCYRAAETLGSVSSPKEKIAACERFIALCEEKTGLMSQLVTENFSWKIHDLSSATCRPGSSVSKRIDALSRSMPQRSPFTSGTIPEKMFPSLAQAADPAVDTSGTIAPLTLGHLRMVAQTIFDNHFNACISAAVTSSMWQNNPDDDAHALAMDYLVRAERMLTHPLSPTDDECFSRATITRARAVVNARSRRWGAAADEFWRFFSEESAEPKTSVQHVTALLEIMRIVKEHDEVPHWRGVRAAAELAEVINLLPEAANCDPSTPEKEVVDLLAFYGIDTTIDHFG